MLMNGSESNNLSEDAADKDFMNNPSSLSHALPESVWEAIFDSIPDLVTVIDKNCKVVRANKAMLERIGKTENLMAGHFCYETIHGMNHPHEGCPHVEMLKDGKGHVGELYEPLLDGVFLVSTTPVFDQNGDILGSVHIARDITGRKKAEEKLQEYNKELEELNTSKDKFFSVIAHDLKSPFQGLMGFTDLLMDEYEHLEKDEVRKYIQNIRNASHNTYALLENLLEWSRMQSGRLQFKISKFDLSKEISGVMEILNSNAIRKSIQLTNKVQYGLEIDADQNMIHSVIQNLVSNAIKFSNNRGEIIVTSEIKPLQSSHKTTECGCSRKCVQINVRDNGIGIHPDALPRIFNMNDHYTSIGTANEPGTGLGLIICKEMIELHGGEMFVESKPGEGSTFSFILPLPASFKC
ncbi:MAG: PAS domain-containing sensor histidine kinase [Bacteroidales bacterium]|nr:PAS domain-containing sensor histidine kinase [Bacteroidales bacterium]